MCSAKLGATSGLNFVRQLCIFGITDFVFPIYRAPVAQRLPALKVPRAVKQVVRSLSKCIRVYRIWVIISYLLHKYFLFTSTGASLFRGVCMGPLICLILRGFCIFRLVTLEVFPIKLSTSRRALVRLLHQRTIFPFNLYVHLRAIPSFGLCFVSSWSGPKKRFLLSHRDCYILRIRVWSLQVWGRTISSFCLLKK